MTKKQFAFMKSFFCNLYGIWDFDTNSTYVAEEETFVPGIIKNRDEEKEITLELAKMKLIILQDKLDDTCLIKLTNKGKTALKNILKESKMKFLNYEVAMDFAKTHPDATVKLDGKSYTVNGCINCNALTADGEDWCPRCKEMVDANKEVNEAIFAATGVII